MVETSSNQVPLILYVRIWTHTLYAPDQITRYLPTYLRHYFRHKCISITEADGVTVVLTAECVCVVSRECEYSMSMVGQ